MIPGISFSNADRLQRYKFFQILNFLRFDKNSSTSSPAADDTFGISFNKNHKS